MKLLNRSLLIMAAVALCTAPFGAFAGPPTSDQVGKIIEKSAVARATSAKIIGAAADSTTVGNIGVNTAAAATNPGGHDVTITTTISGASTGTTEASAIKVASTKTNSAATKSVLAINGWATTKVRV